MKRLLLIELQKLQKNSASRILILTYFILLSFIALLASVKLQIGSFELKIADQGIFNFPYIWHFNTYIASVLKFFLAIVIVSMVSNEYSYGTLKQHLIDGLSKKEFILSKFLSLLLLAAASTVFVFILSLVLGLYFSNNTEFSTIFSDLDYLLAYFVKLIGFFSFCLFLGILVKRAAFALGFLFVWFLSEKIGYGLLLKLTGFSETTVNKIYSCFPLESMSNLIPEPFSRLSFIKSIGTQIGVVDNKAYSVPLLSMLLVLFWTVIFMLISYKLLKKRDL